MTISTFFFCFALLISTILILSVFMRKVGFPIVILSIFILTLAATIKVQFYEGYAIRSKFIADGQEALILSVYESSDDYQVLLRFMNEKRPRLVAFPKTENDGEMKKAKEQANMVLRFGRKAGKQGEGERTDQESDGFEVIGMEKSKEFGK